MGDLYARYRALSRQQQFDTDPAQLACLEPLQALIDSIERPPRRLSFRSRHSQSAALQGIWLYGPVGRGKTLLMDLFCQQLPAHRSQRLHFHHFMRRVHQQLTALSGQPDPLVRIAEQISADIDILCFDEFFVSDIGDAMLLGRLMAQLFQRGTVLVATSNQHPDQLYADGLQRQRFVPAIDLLKQHCRIIHLDGGLDHRRRQLNHADLFLLNPDRSRLQLRFEQLAGPALVQGQPIALEGRSVSCEQYNDHAAWFDFDALCEGPRSANDYMALAERFGIILLSGIPDLKGSSDANWVVQGTEDMPASATNRRRFLGSNDDRTRRFIALIDELYDQSVLLLAAAEVTIGQLYPSGALSEPFERTRSRLIEMQSEAYRQRCIEHCRRGSTNVQG
ncbi:AFG1 family ATPase [Motiliproteus coralliicola]|uniref:AFG1 family ATPase n=1 Tax=Motiliproteus coralliicola TaxID=2283196 RepID=A0A369WUW3_9GAMM|nr:cell division protein ZapE [Motiliproteus coralliicola]RDE24326.1 AFG1 family ATPase [Motiliproteus coralliicola]